jgi:probable phosphoglycerate mutase
MTLIRHGQSTANAAGLITGASDPALSDRGTGQAEELSRRLADSYDGAFHSGLRRSRDTLDLSVAGKEIGRMLVDPRVAERSMGKLEGKPSRPLPAYDRGDLEWAPAGGEPYLSVARRILSFLLDLVDESDRAGRPLTVLASTHVGPMRIAAGILGGLDDPVAVLTSQFPNAIPVRSRFESVDWPPFLDLEVAKP